ncbi:Lipoprotein [Hyphomicrobium sp. 1Nfss2.1]
MVMLRIHALLATALLGLAASAIGDARAEEEFVGRSVTLAGRKVSCGKADIMIDRSLPSEGGAGETILILNPTMLNQQPPTVRLFVFNHECGHLTVGDSELAADCHAVHRGVAEGWLDRKGLKQVCDSFEGAPETDTHPSAKRRCAYLDKCFAKALVEQTPIAPKPIPVRLPNKVPEAITASAPELPVAKKAALGQAKVISAWRCTDPLDVTGSNPDPIGHAIKKDEERAERCR